MALSGGGVRGIAHLGAWQAMKEREIFPDIISGTSAGSLAGAFYADGHEPADVYGLFRSVKIREVVSTSIPHGGFLKTTGIENLLKKNLRARRFEDLNVPLRVVTSDIEKGKEHVFSTGDLIPAVVASCSVPVVFIPVKIGDSFYVDGGMFMNFPVSVIREDCEKVIGVDVSPVVTNVPYDQSFRYIIERTMNYMVGANTVEERKLCDFILESAEIAQYSFFDMRSRDEIFEKGYRIAADYLDVHKEEIIKEKEIPPPPKKKGLLLKLLRIFVK